jgi:hypothetical protein
MKTILCMCIVISVALVSGCSIAVDQIKKTDEDLAKVTKQCEDTTVMSMNCGAGFHTGITSTATLSEKGRLGLEAVNKHADKEGPVYKCCYAIGARYALTYEELVGVMKRAINMISGGIGSVVAP